MENYEKYLKLKAKLGELSEKPNRLREELVREERQLADLEDEATKAAVLDEKGAAKLKQQAEDKALHIEVLKNEIAESEKAPAVIAEALRRGGELWGKALDELQAKSKGPYAAAARALYRKLKEAEALEDELVRISEEAAGQGSQLGNVTIVPGLTRICVGSHEVMGHFSPMGAFVRDCKAARIELE